MFMHWLARCGGTPVWSVGASGLVPVEEKGRRGGGDTPSACILFPLVFLTRLALAWGMRSMAPGANAPQTQAIMVRLHGQLPTLSAHHLAMALHAVALLRVRPYK